MSMYQGPNETLKEWLARYNKEIVIIGNCLEEAYLFGAISSISTDIPFQSDLDAKPLQTWKEFLYRATKFINAEEAQILRNRRPKSIIVSGGESSDRKKRPADNGSRESFDKRQKPGNDDKHLSFKQFETYTELNTGIEDIYYNIRNRDLLRRLPPMKKDPARRNQSKYCSFYRKVGHLTFECNDIKNEIKDLIRRGYLKEYNKENKKGRGNHKRDDRGDRRDDQRDDRRRGDRDRSTDRGDQNEERAGIIRTITGGLYIGGDTQRSQKQYARKAKEDLHHSLMSLQERQQKVSR